MDFLNENAGTYRVPGGRLSATAGTIAAIDSVIQSILDGGSTIGERAEEIVEAAKKAAGVGGASAGKEDKFAEYYIKVAEKVRANAGYVNKELARLEGLLKKGGLAPEKLDDLTTRSNILRKFTQVVVSGTEKQEL